MRRLFTRGGVLAFGYFFDGIGRHKKKLGIGIDKPADEPWTSYPVDVDV